jgi:hypothetical protein
MSEFVEVDSVPIAKRDTEKAWLVETPEGKEVWVPKSLSTWEPKTREFCVAQWFAEREGLV